VNATLARAVRVSPSAVTSRRKKLALAVAALADAAQLGFLPIFGEGALSIPDDVLDAAVALVLLLTLGFRWRLAMALLVELVPGATLFPTWTAVVLSLPTSPADETTSSST
jgi:hypothetical protein